MKKVLLFVFLIFTFSFLIAQSNIQQTLSVNADGSAPNASAQLDVSATDKGMLVPRMTTAQRTAIASPATGLLVFDTTTGGFWFYNGTWVSLSAPKTLQDNDGNTKVQVEKNPNEDIIRFDLGGTEKMVLRNNANGIQRLELDDALNNLFIGKDAGVSHTTGVQNTAISKGALFSNTTGSHNTALGFEALRLNTIGNNNTAVGRQALTSNVSGINNTGVGFRALQDNTTGNYNTASGVDALNNNTEGHYNVAIGFGAMASNTTGYSNTAVGYKALNDNNSNLAYENTAVGMQALYSNTGGNRNTAVGHFALSSNTNGYWNTAIGHEVLISNVNGANNTGIGSNALSGNTTGTQNVAVGLSTGSIGNDNFNCTFIGYDAEQSGSSGDYYNSTALGAEARITASNQVRIGNSSITSIGGFANWTDVSDGRFKQNLQEDVPGLSFLLKLRPLTYTLDASHLAAHLQEGRIEDFEKENGNAPQRPSALALQSRQAKSRVRQTGFVAQEVEQAAQSIGFDFSGVDKPENEEGLYGLRYAEFVPPLVKAVQEQQAEIEALKTENERLKNVETQLDDLSRELGKITAALQGAGIAVEK